MQVGQLGGQRPQVVGHRALRGAAEDDVQLGDGDGDPDAGEHAVHDGGADGERRAGDAQAAQPELGDAREDGDGACGAPSVLLDEVGGDHRETGGGPADLERAAAEPSDDDPADGGRDEPGLEGGAGGEGDAQGQGECDQEDRDRGRHVGSGDAEAASGRRAVGRVDSIGPGRVVGTGGDAGGHVSRLLRGYAVAVRGDPARAGVVAAVGHGVQRRDAGTHGESLVNANQKCAR